MKKLQRFILVDDDPVSNMLCAFNIQKATHGAEVNAFTNPIQGLAFIESAYPDTRPPCPTILFLDVNMPEMSGWQFLDYFDTFRESIKNQVHIYMVSSSVNSMDILKANQNNYVLSFLSKPMKKEMIMAILDSLEAELLPV